jgi:hypothetical protein
VWLGVWVWVWVWVWVCGSVCVGGGLSVGVCGCGCGCGWMSERVLIPHRALPHRCFRKRPRQRLYTPLSRPWTHRDERPIKMRSDMHLMKFTAWHDMLHLAHATPRTHGTTRPAVALPKARGAHGDPFCLT